MEWHNFKSVTNLLFDKTAFAATHTTECIGIVLYGMVW